MVSSVKFKSDTNVFIRSIGIEVPAPIPVLTTLSLDPGKGMHSVQALTLDVKNPTPPHLSSASRLPRVRLENASELHVTQCTFLLPRRRRWREDQIFLRGRRYQRRVSTQRGFLTQGQSSGRAAGRCLRREGIRLGLRERDRKGAHRGDRGHSCACNVRFVSRYSIGWRGSARQPSVDPLSHCRSRFSFPEYPGTRTGPTHLVNCRLITSSLSSPSSTSLCILASLDPSVQIGTSRQSTMLLTSSFSSSARDSSALSMTTRFRRLGSPSSCSSPGCMLHISGNFSASMRT